MPRKPAQPWRNRIVGEAEIPASELSANPRNWRTHPDAQRAALDGVLTQVGWVQRVIVNRTTGFILDGHARVEQAAKRGERVPVVYVELSEQEEALVLATLDPLAAMAGRDEDKLRGLIADVGELQVAAVDDLLRSIAPQDKHGLTDEDAVPDEPAVPVTQPGDVWILGRHRLICGDSTDAATVERCLGGSGNSDLCFTSPPYDQQRRYVSGVGDWLDLMCRVFAIVPLAEDGQLLVNLGLVHRDGEWIPYWDPWIDYMRAEGWRRFGWYVWDQGPGLPGDWAGRLAPAFEFVFHFNRKAKKPNKTADCKWAGTENHGKGLRSADGSVTDYTAAGESVQDHKIPDSVIRVGRHKARGIEVTHPAVFSVGFAREFIAAYSNSEQVVYDPFLGSGTTVIAAEQTGRSCYGIELEPSYCDVIVKRWQDYTGKQACNEDGETFDSVARGRGLEVAA